MSDIIDWLQENNVPNAPKQLLMDSGLNVFAFDLVMESFGRQRPEVAALMPNIFSYEHEGGLWIFVQKKPVGPDPPLEGE